MDTKLGPVATLAARQHGIVARRQLLLGGFSTDQVKGLVRAGVLHPIHRGVYAVGHANVSREGRWMAAVLATGPDSVLSHTPAGQLQGIVGHRERAALHVSVPGRNGRSIAGIITHRPRALPPADTTVRLGIPVTTGTRTVWDLATVLSPIALRRAFEQAEKLGALDRERLAALLAAQPNHRGTGALRELVGDPPLPLGETRSRLEEIVLEVCRDHSLPPPAVNVPLLGFEVDFLWEEARFVVEADGAGHLSRPQRDRDNERDIALGRAGYLVRRYTSRAIGRGGAVATEIASVLAERLSR